MHDDRMDELLQRIDELEHRLEQQRHTHDDRGRHDHRHHDRGHYDRSRHEHRDDRRGYRRDRWPDPPPPPRRGRGEGDEKRVVDLVVALVTERVEQIVSREIDRAIQELRSADSERSDV